MLHVIEHGVASERTDVLIAHGLFGSARNWGVIARRLSSDRLVRVVDMRNHGDSFRDPSHRYVDLAGDLAELLVRPTDVIGHSMGGKAAMALALLHPDRLRRLVVADIAPVAYQHTQLPLIEAMRSLDLTAVAIRGEADAALAAGVPDPGIRAFLLQSLDLKAGRWKLNLDALSDQMPQIMGWPDLAGQYEAPVLFLSGGASDYVRPDHRPAIRRHFPAARFARLPGAAHWLHAERPREFEATCRAFLDHDASAA